MTTPVALACREEIAEIPVTKILPVRKLTAGTLASSKYLCIAASIREIGVIEPLIVYPQGDAPGFYMLLDGHIRLHAVRDLGRQTVECFVANDDEAYTYNHKVNHVSPIQEHFMIRRAIKNGVPEERLARTLNVDVSSIYRKRDLLEGVCPEAVELLKEKPVTSGAIREIRRVRPIRQIEMAELMIASLTYSIEYARCLVAATPVDQLIEAERSKEVPGLSAEDVARIERETESLERDFLEIKETHGRNMLNLVIVVRYLEKLTGNARVARYLGTHHPDELAEIKRIVESRSLSDVPNPGTGPQPAGTPRPR